MNLQQQSEEATRALDAEHKRALADVKEALKAKADYARAELPKIEREIAEFDQRCREKVDSINWKALDGMPINIAEFRNIDQQRAKVGILKNLLRRFDRLTWEDCWGHRADGQRDRNASVNLIGDFDDFNRARGAVLAIQNKWRHLDHALKEEEARRTWNTMTNANAPRPAASSIIVPTPDDGVTVLGDLPPEAA